MYPSVYYAYTSFIYFRYQPDDNPIGSKHVAEYISFVYFRYQPGDNPIGSKHVAECIFPSYILDISLMTTPQGRNM